MPFASSYPPTVTHDVVVAHETESRFAKPSVSESLPGPTPDAFVEGSGAALADHVDPDSASIKP